MNEQEFKKGSQDMIKYIRETAEESIALIEDDGIISAVRTLKRMVAVVEHFKNRVFNE